ncbi:MAG: cell division protein ZapA [Rhodobacteraceae bacterium]|nr:cell division protein ZapA [Paracoccaceae bacterium]MCF8515390.1 cell division protein ZapA [Paracoccaceae bacterium]MCF8519635.1 cell division protein ZapA [Paracoccaceae bacterium]
MPDVTIKIGGRDFQVACQTGEEHFLQAAAAMLNAEADPLVQQMGRLPEARMLLMAGLMLADKTAALEDENRQIKARMAELEQRPKPAAEKVEVPVIPPHVRETLAEIAARAEAMADRIEDKLRA